MRLLLDTNVFLEVLLEQERTEEAETLLQNQAAHDLFVSDFSLHSIGVLLFRAGKYSTYKTFVQDFGRMGIKVAGLASEELCLIESPASSYGLDFDDAYQYTVAEHLDLQIVSFDRDFDKTARKRMDPSQVLK